MEGENEPKLNFVPKPDVTFGMEYHLVQVLHIESPGCFYIRKFDDKDHFERFQAKLNDYYSSHKSSLLNINDILLGSYWCVFHDGSWLRAKALEKNVRENKVSMRFVDTGITKLIHIRDVYMLEEEFCLDKEFSIPCCLYNVYCLNNKWSSDEMKKFSNLCVSSFDFRALFVGKTLNSLIEVVLESPQNIVINEEMLSNSEVSCKIDEYLKNNKEKVLQNDDANNIIEEPTSDDLQNWNPMLEDFDSSKTKMDSECAETMFVGIKNEDEKNICKYYRKRKKCPYGDICRYRHVTPRNDGLPTQEEITYYDFFVQYKLPEEESITPAIVTTVTSPSLFYVQFPEITNSAFTELKKEMNEYYKKAKASIGYGTTFPAIGSLMAANITDGVLKGWQRARVLSIEGDEECASVNVDLVDYGYEMVISERHLVPMCPGFLHQPAMALECFLYGIKPPEGGWSKKASNYFHKLTENKSLIAEIISVDEINERLGIQLIDTWTDEYVVISHSIVEKGYGTFTE